MVQHFFEIPGIFFSVRNEKLYIAVPKTVGFIEEKPENIIEKSI